VRQQLVAGDREEIRPKARVAAEPIAGLEARQHRALHEVIGDGLGLVAEEAVQRIEVALEQRAGGLGIPGPPALEQRIVGLFDHRAPS
jgi:hypothetical protein